MNGSSKIMFSNNTLILIQIQVKSKTTQMVINPCSSNPCFKKKNYKKIRAKKFAQKKKNDWQTKMSLQVSNIYTIRSELL